MQVVDAKTLGYSWVKCDQSMYDLLRLCPGSGDWFVGKTRFENRENLDLQLMLCM